MAVNEAQRAEAKNTINVIRDDLRKMYDAIDDLWSCIGAEEILHLQPDTIVLAQAVHEIVWHRQQEEVAHSESH
jgi:hypothetical protein